eukprot:31032-Pelagococcus_subviridis.AAC.8
MIRLGPRAIRLRYITLPSVLYAFMRLKLTRIATYATARSAICIPTSARKHVETETSSISNASMTSSPVSGHEAPYRACVPAAHSNVRPLNSFTTIAVNAYRACESHDSHRMNDGMDEKLT